MFFLLYHRCNVEKVPSNSQLEIEGNRSGSVLYSRVSKYRYPCAKPASPAASRGPVLGARGGGADVPAHPTPAVASGVACSVPMWGVHSLNARLAKASPAPQPWVSAPPPPPPSERSFCLSACGPPPSVLWKLRGEQRGAWGSRGGCAAAGILQ